MPNSLTFSVDQPSNSVAKLEAYTKMLQEQRASLEVASIESQLKRQNFNQSIENLRFGDTELVNRADYLPVGFNLGFGTGGLNGPFTYTSTTDRFEGRDYPFVMSEVDLNYARGMARFILKTHCPGVAIERNLKSHVISEGGNYTAGRKKKMSVPDGLISLVQDVIDEFIHENKIDGELEQEWFWRPRRDGDMFVALYPHKGRGVCRARELEPERIRTPGQPMFTEEEINRYYGMNIQESTNWSFGIHKSDADIQKVYGYSVDWDCQDNLDGWEYLPEKYVEMRKVNVDRNIARGMTDFYPAWTWLKQQQRLLLNTGEGAAERAAISYIVEHVQGVVKGQAVSMRQDQSDYSYTINNPQGNSKTFYKEYRPAGSKLDVPKGQEYVPIAQGVDPSGAYLEVVQAILRQVGSMWAMPEGMISGKMDAGAYASAIAAGSLFSKYATMEQGSFQAFMGRVIWKMLRFAYEQGRFVKFGFAPNDRGSWYSFQRHIEVIIHHPDVATQDPQKGMVVSEMQRRIGMVSLKTLRDQYGYDDETETRNIADEPQAQPASGQSGTPPDPGSGDNTSGQTEGQKLGEIKGPSNSQFGGVPKNYTDVQSQIESAVNKALGPLLTQLRQSTESAHAPKGFSHDKPLILDGKSYIGGEFIPGKSQQEVDSAAGRQQDKQTQEDDPHSQVSQHGTQQSKEPIAAVHMSPEQIQHANKVNAHIASQVDWIANVVLSRMPIKINEDLMKQDIHKGASIDDVLDNAQKYVETWSNAQDKIIRNLEKENPGQWHLPEKEINAVLHAWVHDVIKEDYSKIRGKSKMKKGYFEKISDNINKTDADGLKEKTHENKNSETQEKHKDFKSQFDAAYDKVNAAGRGRGLLKVYDLRKALNNLSDDEFNKGLRKLRESGHYTMDSSQGGYVPMTTDERNAGIKEGSTNLVYVDRKRTWQPSSNESLFTDASDINGEFHASEARAPAGYNKDKPFIIGGQQFVGGQFIPNASQDEVDREAGKQSQDAAENKDTPSQVQSPSSGSGKETPDNPKLGTTSNEDDKKKLQSLMDELSAKKKHVISFPIERISNVNEQDKPGDFEGKSVPPCIISHVKLRDKNNSSPLLIGNDIVLYAKSKGKPNVPAIIADEQDQSVEPLLGDQWAKWMYSRIDKTESEKFEQQKKAVESMSWLDYLGNG